MISALCLLLVSCEGEGGAKAVGTLERDRIELVAEAHEPIIEILVREGDRVKAGQALVVMDSRQHQARHAQAKARRDGMAAKLAELKRGPRAERIDAAKARLNGAEESLVEVRKELSRAQRLRKDGTISQSHLDGVQIKFTQSVSRRDELKAQLQEMLQGTTIEELLQGEAALAEADAALIAIQIQLERMTLKAPLAGTVDALLFERGERPRPGNVVAVLLADGPAYAKAYLPAPWRAQLNPGDPLLVLVDGQPEPYQGRLRFISSEAAFTPYFSLTEHDRTRLTYLAEIDLVGSETKNLPVGIPVEVFLEGADE
jgi:HlyD family secretion protein